MKKNITLFGLLVLIPVFLFSQGMKVTPGTKVTVNTGATMKITNGGNLLLQDDLSSSPSFLQYLSKDIWHMVGSPTDVATINAYRWMYLYEYDEATESWQYLNKPATTPLNVGQGYFVWPYTIDPNGTYPPSPDSAVLKGTLNYQNVNLNLSYTASATEPGWNLVGNPFPCAIDWNNHANWNRTNVDAAVYVYDNSAGGGSSGNYRVYNCVTTVGIPFGNDGIIASTQGFWLKANSTGASVTIPISQRLHSNKAFYKNSDSEWNNMLRLRADDHNSISFYESVIAFTDEATGSFDSQYDGAFLKGRDGAMSFYTIVENIEYSINFLPSYEDYMVVQLNFICNQSGEYSITATNLESFPFSLPIYLEDKKDDSFQNLRENPEYNFVSEVENDAARFNVHFSNPLGIEDNSIAIRIHIYSHEKTIYIDIPEDIKADIYVYNLLGEHIISENGEPGLNQIKVIQNNTYYLVKVISEEEMISKKVYIK